MAASVGGPHLEREARAVVADALEQLDQQRGGDADAAHVGIDGDVHHVPDRVVARADQVADQDAVAARGQAHPAGLGELEHEHRQRPRRREGAALDGDDLREVGVGEAADVERGGHRRGTASGRRTYSGRRASRSTGRASRASRHTARALAPCSGEASAGTSAAGSSRSRNRTAPSPTASHGAWRGSARAASALGRDGHRGQEPLAVAEGRGVRLAAARVEHGQHGAVGAGRRGQRLERRDGGDLGARRLGQGARGGDADPQPREGARPDADADPAHVGEVRPDARRAPGAPAAAAGSRGRGARRARGSWRSSTGSPSSGRTATTVAGVAVSSPRITSR